MKTRYRLIRRGNRNGAFYCGDTKIGKRTSLATSKEDEAVQIVQARNQAEQQPSINLQIARAYLIAVHPAVKPKSCRMEPPGSGKLTPALPKSSALESIELA